MLHDEKNLARSSNSKVHFDINNSTLPLSVAGLRDGESHAHSFSEDEKSLMIKMNSFEQ